VLGGCHDNGYAPFLESYRGNHKIGLLETTPPAAEFRKFTFKRVAFPSVFRSEPVPTVPKSTVPLGFTPVSMAPPIYQTPIASPPVRSPTVTNGLGSLPSPPGTASPKKPAPAALVTSKPEAQPNSYATVGRSTPSTTINIASQKKAVAPRPYYQLNKKDERVDIPLAKPDPGAIKSLEDRRQMSGMNLCNRYHLGNSCKNTNCNFYHGERLNAAELLALRHKTRNLVCSAGHYCREIACNLGHHCANAGSCYFGDDCRFSEMHGMDLVSIFPILLPGFALLTGDRLRPLKSTRTAPEKSFKDIIWGEVDE
jgi:hypothetical protein